MPASDWEEMGREKKTENERDGEKNKGQEIKTWGKRYSEAGRTGGMEKKKDGGSTRSQRRMNKSEHAEGSIYGGHKSVKKKKKSGSV